MSDLTRDNSHYQDLLRHPNADAPYLQSIAQGGLLDTSLPDHVRDYVSQCIATNTRRAYTSDLNRFRKWGGKLPSDAAVVAIYLADHAETHSVSTLRRWAASLSRAHTAAGLPDPTKQEPARSTLRGISRERGAAVRCAAPLLRDDLFLALDALANSARDSRDRALLLVGFASGFRRSELTALNLEDVAFVRRGIIITLRRSKTDQGGIGRDIAVPLGKTRHCPVAALEAWLSRASISGGPIFRPVTKCGLVLTTRLSAEAVSNIVKQRVADIGLDPMKFSGHSLRAGFATSAAQAGVSSWKIRQQTGHASDAMLARYIRCSELFVDNAAGAVL